MKPYPMKTIKILLFAVIAACALIVITSCGTPNPDGSTTGGGATNPLAGAIDQETFDAAITALEAKGMSPEEIIKIKLGYDALSGKLDQKALIALANVAAQDALAKKLTPTELAAVNTLITQVQGGKLDAAFFKKAANLALQAWIAQQTGGLAPPVTVFRGRSVPAKADANVLSLAKSFE
jgi:hypothetical protein